jgi:hypothetical protein
MAFPFVHDGIPILYYGLLQCGWRIYFAETCIAIGQEQGYTGAADPENREA